MTTHGADGSRSIRGLYLHLPQELILILIRDCDVNLKLRLVDVRHLNHRIEMDWTEWVEEAPSAWKEDGFLLKHVPITVTSRYGQDQPICALDSRDNEARNWHEERDYRKIRFVSVGLATHVRFAFYHFLLVCIILIPYIQCQTSR